MTGLKIASQDMPNTIGQDNFCTASKITFSNTPELIKHGKRTPFLLVTTVPSNNFTYRAPYSPTIMFYKILLLYFIKRDSKQTSDTKLYVAPKSTNSSNYNSKKQHCNNNSKPKETSNIKLEFCLVCELVYVGS